MTSLSNDSMTTIENLKNFLEYERMMESNVNDAYTPRLSAIYTAFRDLDALVATVEQLRTELAQRAKPDAQVALDFPTESGWYAFKGTWWGRPVTRVFRVGTNLSIWSGATPVKLGTDIVGKFYKLHMPWLTAPVEGQPVQVYIVTADQTMTSDNIAVYFDEALAEAHARRLSAEPALDNYGIPIKYGVEPCDVLTQRPAAEAGT